MTDSTFKVLGALPTKRAVNSAVGDPLNRVWAGWKLPWNFAYELDSKQ